MATKLASQQRSLFGVWEIIETSHNSLVPRGAIWLHKFKSTLAQVMAWYLAAPSHYLNQCWLMVHPSTISQKIHKAWYVLWQILSYKKTWKSFIPDSNVGCPNVVPTSALSSRRWANASPTFIIVGDASAMAQWVNLLLIGVPLHLTGDRRASDVKKGFQGRSSSCIPNQSLPSLSSHTMTSLSSSQLILHDPVIRLCRLTSHLKVKLLNTHWSLWHTAWQINPPR